MMSTNMMFGCWSEIFASASNPSVAVTTSQPFLLQQRFRGAPDGLRVIDDHDLHAGQVAIFVCLFHVQPPIGKIASQLEANTAARPLMAAV
jgi:hypothetical protein